MTHFMMLSYMMLHLIVTKKLALKVSISKWRAKVITRWCVLMTEVGNRSKTHIL